MIFLNKLHGTFIDVGYIVEVNEPEEFFTNPRNQRLREFQSGVL